MSRPCVVMISAGFHPYIGGAERQALELSKTLQRLGMRVMVITRRLDDLKRREDVEGIQVFRLAAKGRGFSNSVSFMFSCFTWLLANSAQFQAIHVHLAGSPALSAALAGRILGKPVIIKLGGGRGIGEIAASSRTFAGRWKIRLLKWLHPQFVCVTKDLVEEMKEYGMNGSPVVLPNGVDVRRFSPLPRSERMERRNAAGLHPGTVNFLYVGRLGPEKQLDRFLAAFADALRAVHKEASFSLVGSGEQEQALREQVEKLGLQSSVKFYGPVPDIERFYQIADVFVLPSVSEGLSNALLEAMASGLAVLASRVGGTREAVKEEVTGLLFDPSDAKAMRKQLQRFLEEPGLSETMGFRAREAALSNFDLGSVARKYVKLYKLGSSS